MSTLLSTFEILANEMKLDEIVGLVCEGCDTPDARTRALRDAGRVCEEGGVFDLAFVLYQEAFMASAHCKGRFKTYWYPCLSDLGIVSVALGEVFVAQDIIFDAFKEAKGDALARTRLAWAQLSISFNDMEGCWKYSKQAMRQARRSKDADLIQAIERLQTRASAPPIDDPDLLATLTRIKANQDAWPPYTRARLDELDDSALAEHIINFQGHLVDMRWPINKANWPYLLQQLLQGALNQGRGAVIEILADRCLEGIHDPLLCTLAVEGLHKLSGQKGFDPKYDRLALRATMSTMARSERVTDSRYTYDAAGNIRRSHTQTTTEWWLKPALKALPRARREAILCFAPMVPRSGRGPYGAWIFAPATHTPAVARRLVQAATAFPMHKSPELLADVQDTFFWMRKVSAEPLMAALNAGSTSANRGALSDALAWMDQPACAPYWLDRLWGGVKGTLGDARRAEDALALRPELVPVEALRDALSARGLNKRRAASRLLARMPLTPARHAMAAARLTREKHPQVRAHLERVAARLPWSSDDDLDALAAIRDRLLKEAPTDETLDKKMAMEHWRWLVHTLDFTLPAEHRASWRATFEEGMGTWPDALRPLFEEMRDAWLDGQELSAPTLARAVVLDNKISARSPWAHLLGSKVLSSASTLSLVGSKLDRETFERLIEAEIFRDTDEVNIVGACEDPEDAVALVRSDQLEGCRKVWVFAAPDPMVFIEALCCDGSPRRLEDLALLGEGSPLSEAQARRLAGSERAEGLRSLNLGGLSLTPAIIHTLFGAETGLSGLRTLRLMGCGLDDACLETMAGCSALASVEFLQLDHNPTISGRGLAAFFEGSGAALTGLSVEECALEDGDAALWAAAGFSSLEALHAANNTIGPRGLESLFALPWPNLKTLILDHCPLGNEGIDALATSPEAMPLEILSLFGTRFHGEGIAKLASSGHVGRLRRLNLNANHLHEAGGLALGKMVAPHLEELLLGGCQLRDRGLVGILGLLDRVHTLHIQDNGLSDESLCALASSEHARSLHSLLMDSEYATRRVVRALASSPWFAETLRHHWFKILKRSRTVDVRRQFPRFSRAH